MTRGAYGVQRLAAGGVVAAVEEGSPAARAGIVPGDVILSVDGRRVRDVLDWRWLTADGDFSVLVSDAHGEERTALVEPEWHEAPGLEFTAALFDGVRECDNACEFCFVSQLPNGLRPSLYVRDDDYRLSFLDGNFVTLTNVDDGDVERIIEQRLSPLHLSVHAVDAEVRRSLICPTVEDRAMESTDRLLEAGIEIHAQVVLVPGRNDGAVLRRTLAWLAERPGILSVGVVPVGRTRSGVGGPRSYADSRAADEVLHALEPWRARMARERGVPWVYAADELHLAAGREVPPADEYGGFPQYENGIGMVRTFIDGWRDAIAVGAGASSSAASEAVADGAIAAPPAAPRVALVTGELFAPVLRGLLASDPPPGPEVRVLAVPNGFFGGNVSVAGLLTARDVCAAVGADRPASGSGVPWTYLVPDAMLNTDGVTLDDAAEADLAGLCAADVRVVSSDVPDLVSALRSLSVG